MKIHTDKALSEAPRVRSLMLRSMRLREWILSACVLSISATGAVAGLPYCKAGPQTGRPLDTYVPMDSWVYPALDRLHGLGYLDTAFLGIRPWTTRSIQRMIDETSQVEGIQNNGQASEIVAALHREFGAEDDYAGDFSYACEGIY